MELLQFCLELYLIKIDSWNVSLSNSRYNFDDKRLATVSSGGKTFPNAFGDLIVGNGEIMEWKFKLTNATEAKPIMIGVIEEDKAELTRDKLGDFFACTKKTEGGRAYYCYLGMIYGSNHKDQGYITDSFEETVKKHDMVIMVLDMSKDVNTLSFKSGYFGKDELIDHGVAFDDIEPNKKYRMAISVYDEDDNVQIIP